jgi:hypothetical protein
MSRRRYRPWMLFALLLAAPSATRLAAAERDQQTPPMPTPPPAAQAEQQQPPRGTLPGHAQKVFVIRNVPVQELARVLAVFPADIKVANENAHLLGVRAAPAVLAAIEETIGRLDIPAIPAKSIELTGYILEALRETPAAPAEALPKELDGVIAQLENTFRYGAYRLVDTVIALGRDDSGLQANANVLSAQGKTFYQLRVRRAAILRGTAPVVRLDGLFFDAALPAAEGARDQPAQQVQSVLTDLDIREGQHVVLGKSGTGKDGRAIILVLSAKILD